MARELQTEVHQEHGRRAMDHLAASYEALAASTAGRPLEAQVHAQLAVAEAMLTVAAEIHQHGSV